MEASRIPRMLFTAGDYLAGGILGAATAAAVRATISPQCNMVIAMILGMLIGMVVHVAVGLLLSPVVGFFHSMVPGSLIGMYGGMIFAMRDTMRHAAGTPDRAILTGVLFGLIVIFAVQLYDRALRVSTSGDHHV